MISIILVMITAFWNINAPPGNIGILSIAVASNGDIWVVTADEVYSYYIFF